MIVQFIIHAGHMDWNVAGDVCSNCRPYINHCKNRLGQAGIVFDSESHANGIYASVSKIAQTSYVSI